MQKNAGIRLARTIHFICNNEIISTEINPAASALDFIRTQLHLNGTKESCREGDCGACSILIGELNGSQVNYKTVNSCILPIGALAGKHIVTIEGLNQQNLNPVQQSFINESAIQCGFCTPGFIVSLTGSLLSSSKINYVTLLAAIDGNICRCTGYASIKRSIINFVDLHSNKINQANERTKELVQYGIVPEYFLSIPDMLNNITKEAKEDYITNGLVTAGGTDIFLQKNKEIENEGIIFIETDSKLPKIYIENNECRISASATVNEIRESSILNKILPDIKEYFSLFGSTQIRNRATLGGNIINASPIGDMTIFFLVLNSILHFSEDGKLREVSMSEFYKGYKLFDKKPKEILETISFRIPEKGLKINFEKISRRTYLDIASVNSAILINVRQNIITDISISAGGVAPFPMLLKKTSKYLNGKQLCLTNLKEACEIAEQEISPISDVRGSAEYKTILVKQIILAHFNKLFPDLIKAEELVW